MVNQRLLLTLVSVFWNAEAFVSPSKTLVHASLELVKSKRRSVLISHSTVSDASSTLGKPIDTEVKGKIGKDDQFNWSKSWYPIVPVEILDPEIPHKYQLLGMDIVVWKDAVIEGADFGPKKKKKSAKRNGGEWRVFVDECPHRKVPLSEGRVENDGSLLCSYHGWRFDGKGDLVDAPQIGNDSALERTKANPKSRCNSFPTKIVDGVLWVWPETGDDARLESALSSVPSYKLPDGVDESRVWYGPWNYRQLPYGADYFIENVVDPAHVQVSHHNIVGNRYGDQKANMRMRSDMNKDGFSVEVSSDLSENPSTTTFRAPCTVAIETKPSEGAIQTLELYASPSVPGFCNHVGRMVIVKPKDGKMPKLLRQFTLPVPIWVNHLMASLFLNQDALFLHHQERYLDKTGEYTTNINDKDLAPAKYVSAVLPMEMDRGVLAFRDWLRKRAGGRIPYKYSPKMPAPDNEVVFNVWKGHTSYCRYCQTALKNLKIARYASFFVATCLAVVRPVNKLVTLAGVLSTAFLGLVLNKIIGLFYRYEFSHSHND